MKRYKLSTTSNLRPFSINRRSEDRFSATASTDGARLLLGVYDGHGGAATAEHISKILPPALLACSPEEHTQVFEATDKAMLNAFKTDHPLFSFRRRDREWIDNAQVLRSGCTALVIDIDVPGMLLNYANAGDCRCLVFDRQDSENENSLQQTVDLNAKSQSEQDRLKREHPGEELLVVSGRLFGQLMSTRGFGDGYYKLPRGINNWQHKKYVNALSSLDQKAGKVPLSAQYDSYFYGYRTPPYLVATPDVGTMRLSRDSVVVCGSDGLFDLVTSEVVAQTVRLGIRDGVGNLAAHLLESVIPLGIGDDVTILVLTFS
ncbi:phosphatase 2C-like domain-containing protein [Mycena filopes]|nr:phosphatase 2C-like domain-containing protein [Mycena filopes]